MNTIEATFDRGRPSRWRRLFFKAPIALYRDGPAKIMRHRCVLLLTTTGRRSGLPRTTAVSFMPLDDRFVVFSGMGRPRRLVSQSAGQCRRDRSRGATGNPGDGRPGGRPGPAARVDAPDAGKAGRCGPPRPLRAILQRMGIFDLQGELDLAVAQDEALPVVELIPK